jgi:peptidoglycan/xylan/chitin deacetylase (PgdA/CDA1 family)
MFSAGNTNNAVVNWTDADEDVTIAGTMTFTTYGGFTSDGISAYINTNYNPSTADAVRFKWDSASFGAFSENEISAGAYGLMGLQKTDAAPISYSFLYPRNISDAFIERCNNNGSAQPTVSSTSTVGFFTAQRRGATTYAGVNTVQTTNSTTGQATLPNNSYFIQAICNAPNSVVVGRAAFKVSCAYIGGWLTQSELERLYRAINRYKTRITEGYSFPYGAIGPYIAWVADDGTDRDYTLLYKLAKWRNIKMTSAVITSYIGQSTLLSAAQIQEMHNWGWEFASHSNTHPDLTGVSDIELHNEVHKSDSILTLITGSPCKTFVYPYYLNSQHIADSVRKYYSYGLAGNFGAGFDQINYAPIMDMDIKRSTLNTTNAYLQAEKDIILNCKNNGGILIFAAHASAWTTNDTTNVGILIDYAKSLNIPQLTISDIMDNADVVNKILEW